MRPILIGLAGRAGSGKDTVGGIINQVLMKRGYALKLKSFAKALKSIVQTVYAFTDEQMTDPVLKETPDLRYPRADGTFLTPREAMQKCGTEFGRSCYPDTWADLEMRLAQVELDHGISVAFTDVRFSNEGRRIRQAGGFLWRIRRPSADAVPATHASELEMDTPEFCELVTGQIYNDGTLEWLVGQVKRMMPG